MPVMQDLLGLGTSLVVFILLVAAIMKVFQIAGDLREMKGMVADIRRNAPLSSPAAVHAPLAQPSAMSDLTPLAARLAPPPPPQSLSGAPDPSRPMTAEELVRAVHSQDFSGDKFPL